MPLAKGAIGDTSFHFMAWLVPVFPFDRAESNTAERRHMAKSIYCFRNFRV